ncbi:MAG: hypothetical protein C7B45_02115 [Sulfobacillus acidophilus]|uniref:Threonine/Serine exporter ThrE domain-containing protein n=1 Tax=Sulfobacillus acidophilus TaxID=53633 RepID=A0A2T2WN69_9FIRM|nr:MAG: hypothetical protein C7B45_02115 [Sulfobacillus acidophilus]
MVGAMLSGVTAVAFGLLYQVAGSTLVVAGIIGTLSWAVASVLKLIHGSGLLGDFVGALIVGALAEVAARLKHEPALMFVVPAIIVFVPGELVYQSMVAFLQNHFLSGAQSGLSALMAAGSLSIGLALSTAVLRPLLRQHQTQLPTPLMHLKCGSIFHRQRI